MAEALSVAASGIAIAQVTAQVGVAVVKLKQLLDEVKEVPDDIADLMQQIECLDPALFEAENIFNDSSLPSMLWNDVTAKRSTAYCRNALKALTELVEELSVQINSSRKFYRKIASVKVVLKKATLKKLEKRLENATRMLMFAQHGYSIALTRILPDIIIHEFKALTAHLQPSHIDTPPRSVQACDDGFEDKDENSNSEQLTRPQTTRAISSRPRWRQGYMPASPFGRLTMNLSERGSSIVIQAPSWLCRRSWDLQSFRASGSWQINLRSYCARHPDSEVFEVALRGSPQELQRMFDMGLASPFDYDGYDGATLLHVAALRKDPDMFLYLLSQDLDLTVTNSYGLFAIQYLLSYLDNHSGSTLLKHSTVVESFITIQEIRSAHLSPGSRPSCTCYSGYIGPELYMLLRPHQCPSHDCTSIESRLDSASRGIDHPTVFKMALEPEWTSDLAELCRIATAATDHPLLERIVWNAAWQYGRHICSIRLRLGDNRFSSWSDWFKLSAEIISRAFDTHSVYQSAFGHDGMLRYMLRPFIEDLHPVIPSQVWKRHATILLKAWITSLKDVGVDLVEYGKLETELLQGRKSREERLFVPSRQYFDQYWWDRRDWPREDVAIYLIGYKCGPEPEDWDIYWDEPTDKFAGDFWKLIEDPPPQIPGAWEDAFDD